MSAIELLRKLFKFDPQLNDFDAVLWVYEENVRLKTMNEALAYTVGMQPDKQVFLAGRVDSELR